jgi:hypothetical protein
MQVAAKVEAAGNPTGEPPLAAADRPSGDDLREGRDIVLGVAAVDAQGVQFENFARQVFIDAELALGFLRAVRPLAGERPRPRAPSGELRQIGILADRILIVEKSDHRGVLLHRG